MEIESTVEFVEVGKDKEIRMKITDGIFAGVTYDIFINDVEKEGDENELDIKFEITNPEYVDTLVSDHIRIIVETDFEERLKQALEGDNIEVPKKVKDV